MPTAPERLRLAYFVPPSRHFAGIERVVHEIATGMVQVLYGRELPGGSWTYAADKEWRGSDVCEAAAGLLGLHGLVPEAEGDGEPMEAAAVRPENRAFLQAVGQLLESPELNLDEMEQTTREAIAQVRALLDQQA